LTKWRGCGNIGKLSRGSGKGRRRARGPVEESGSWERKRGGDWGEREVGDRDA